jgi:soluble P-type ATPase
MLKLDIPDFGKLAIEHLVLDFSGTLSIDGILVEGVVERLKRIGSFLEIHILTADTHGHAAEQLHDINATVEILTGDRHTAQKRDYIRKLGAVRCIAVGNGNNDTGMLEEAVVGICICADEGCAIETLQASNVLVHSPLDALDLILNSNRLKATLRR